MELRQACILIIASMIFIPFICSLIEEIVKEYIDKNKSIRKQNMELKSVLEKMVEAEEYRIYKIDFANAMRNL